MKTSRHDRREFLRRSFSLATLAVAGPQAFAVGGCEDGAKRPSPLTQHGPLLAPDANGLMLPAGFTSRVVATSGIAPVASGSYLWHFAPDGGAVFSATNGDYIYVSNAELSSPNGGVGALRFTSGGAIVDAYPILTGSQRNCAGGKMPWGAWLSCEEAGLGLVYECDPLGVETAVARPALGRFLHEAAAYDPEHHHLYLTEDVIDGAFYRFRPSGMAANGYADLSAGTLEVMLIQGGAEEGPVIWNEVPDPSGLSDSTRSQAECTAFNGGEGIVYFEGVIYFSTKGDNRIWAYDTHAGDISILYDDNRFTDPVLRGVDNITVSPFGEIVVAEDGFDQQICVVGRDGVAVPLLQLVGHTGSELTGPAFDPTFTRLYFSSQRGTDGVTGVTFEVSGPFLGA